jgi:membrane fusion protein (multidrug efflux system)
MRLLLFKSVALALMILCGSGCGAQKIERRNKAHKITATNPASRTVTLTQQYVGQIRAERHLQLRAPRDGDLATGATKAGQSVQQDQILFEITPRNNKGILDRPLLPSATESSTLAIRAPFPGIVDRIYFVAGQSVQAGETIATVSDNSVIWVYFNVPEAHYLQHMANLKENSKDLKIELVLGNGNKFDQPGTLGPIEANFNGETGTVRFRADFQNPNHLLRHGQVGTLLISRDQKDAIVIPQRAVFELLDKRYVYVIDKDETVHRREVVIQDEVDDVFVVRSGVGVSDKIVLDGVHLVRDGDKVEYEGQPVQATALLNRQAA